MTRTRFHLKLFQSYECQEMGILGRGPHLYYVRLVLAEREVIPKDNWSQHNIRVLRYCGKQFINNINVLSNSYYIRMGALLLQDILFNYGS